VLDEDYIEEKLEDITDKTAPELIDGYVALEAGVDLKPAVVRVELAKAKVINDDLIKGDLKRDETIKEELVIQDLIKEEKIAE